MCIFIGTIAMSDVKKTEETENVIDDVSSEITIIPQPAKSYDIVVLGDTQVISSIQKSPNYNKNEGNCINNSSDKQKLIIITESWAKKHDDTELQINQMIDHGDIASLYKTSIDWTKINYSISFPLSEFNSFAIVKTDRGTSCFSVICNSDDDAVDRLIEWADSNVGSNYTRSGEDLPIGE